MRNKFFLIVTLLELNLSFLSKANAQYTNRVDTTILNVKPKAIMPKNNIDKIESKLNQDKHNEEKTIENLVQEIIDFNLTDLIKYEKLSYDEEHLSYYLNDTIFFEIQRIRQLIQSKNEDMYSALNKFKESNIDTSKRSKLIPLTINQLRTLYKEEIALKDSLENSNNQEKKKQKEFGDKSKQLKEIQISLKPHIDSLNMIIASAKETTVLRIIYNRVNYRVLIAHSDKSDIKIHNNSNKKLQPLKSVWDTFKDKPYALLNAGMYEIDGSAKGLMVVNGKILKNLDETKKPIEGNFYMEPNGVFYLDSLGRSFVEKTEDYKKKYASKLANTVMYATQSGPMLLTGGKSNPNFQIASTNKNIRNGVGIVDNSGNKITLFIISDSPCTFYEMASLFRLFRCSNALYLDGAISKMYTEIKGIKTGNISEGQLGPILSISKKK
jgi:uncharacterized protein YigE (DUF2233 family)